jgi:hypothetical protein
MLLTELLPGDFIEYHSLVGEGLISCALMISLENWEPPGKNRLELNEIVWLHFLGPTSAGIEIYRCDTDEVVEFTGHRSVVIRKGKIIFQDPASTAPSTGATSS